MQGKLKIYMGYAAGVGKTYRMLKEAHELKQKGIDIIAGYIEPHQRPATQTLVEGIECVPIKHISYRGQIMKEPDIDAIIQRQPDIVLIDELAHHNAPGSRHIKRYQDIEELLHAGINVHTTLNIQHIESLYHTIQQITQVKVSERIPDKLIGKADAIIFVDVEPAELLARLREGRVYQEEQAERALNSFFKLEHLIQLREVALREMANLVDQQLVEQGLHAAEHIIAVGLSAAESNMKVIRSASRLAHAFKYQLVGIYIENDALDDNESSKQLDNNRRLLESLGGRYVSLYGNVVEQLGDWCTVNQVDKLVLGRPLKDRRDIVTNLNKYYPSIDVYIIPTAVVKKHHSLPSININLMDIGKSMLVMTLCTLVALQMFDYNLNESNTITVYMLGVMLCALWTSSKWLILPVSISAVLLFNFFFTAPRFSFEAYRSDYPATFIVMFLAGLIISTLVQNLKRQTKIAKTKSFRTEILLETNKRLMHSVSEEDMVRTLTAQLNKLTGKNVVVLNEEEINRSKQDETTYMKWALHNDMEAGRTTETFSAIPYYILPIKVPGHSYVMMIPIEEEASFDKTIIRLIANDMKNVLEKQRLITENQLQQQEQERERARSSFLKSISHDIRTPLTAIIGNLSLLRQQVQQDDIIDEIETDALWLRNLVNNILAVTKLEHLGTDHHELSVLQDIIYNVYQLTNKRTGSRRLVIEEDDEVFTARIDEKMITQVLLNLVDNAVKYTPEEATITIVLKREQQSAVIEVQDTGRGIDADMQERIFEAYYTSDITSDYTRKGLGLGLYLAQTILKAHHTSLYVRKNQPNGAVFGFRLPIEEVKV